MAHVHATNDQVTANWVGTPNVVHRKGTVMGIANVHIGTMSLVAMTANVFTTPPLKAGGALSSSKLSIPLL